MVKLAGAEPVVVRAGIKQRFKITGKQLERSITENTRLFMINSPSNRPASVIPTRSWRTSQRYWFERPEVVVLTDDIYEHILVGQDGFRNIVNVCPNWPAGPLGSTGYPRPIP